MPSRTMMPQTPLAIGMAAVVAAGQMLRSQLGQPSRIQNQVPGQGDSEQYCLAIELIVNKLRLHFPDDLFLTKQREVGPYDAENCWYINPLDGVKNYMRGYPNFAVSLARACSKKVLLGIVYNPLANEMFTAELGQGAYLNTQRIFVSRTMSVNQALLATTLHRDDLTTANHNVGHWLNLMRQAEDIRTSGSIALDLCHVAAGRLDGFWSMAVQPWNATASALIVQEAGGALLDCDGQSFKLDSTSIIAANYALYPSLAHYLVRVCSTPVRRLSIAA